MSASRVLSGNDVRIRWQQPAELILLQSTPWQRSSSSLSVTNVRLVEGFIRPGFSDEGFDEDAKLDEDVYFLSGLGAMLAEPSDRTRRATTERAVALRHDSRR